MRHVSRAVARAQVRRKLEPRGIHPEDLDPTQGPHLVHTEIPDVHYLSTAEAAPPGGEELAYFGGQRLRVKGTEPYAEWFWADP